MLTLSQVWRRLAEIHDDFVEDLTEAEYQEALDSGIRNPCGCDICDLMLEISLAEIDGYEIKRGTEPTHPATIYGL